jgi:asparagine synthase (glutamine-hydrolysing)
MSHSGRWVIAYNGEAYNFRALRRELEQAGLVFKGTSDTEVLVEAIDHWGLQQAIERTDGMFALAAWDRSRRRLSLVRDRFGEKPMYYGWIGSTLLFGSELRALRAHPSFRAEPDAAAVSAYIEFGYVPAPHSIYAGISKLSPGSIYETDRWGAAALAAWWDPSAVARDATGRPFAGNLTEAAETLHGRMRASVEARMVADVPVGALLSGGIDSSAVVMLASEASSFPVKTFSVGFAQPRFDESPHARRVAEAFGTDHSTMHVSDQDAMNLVPELARIWDEPFSDSSQIPTYFVSALARRAVTVALTGDGGDELFGGYDRYRYFDRLSKVVGLLKWMPHRPVRGLIGGAGRAALAFGNEPLARRLTKAVGIVGVAEPDALYRRLVTTGSGFSANGWHERADPVAVDPLASWNDWPGSVVARAMGVDTVTYLPDDILVKVDRATMARSLEGRLPFLSEAVFEFAWSLPDRLRWDGNGGKLVLRRMLAGHLPVELVERPKQGFGVPLGEWLRNGLRVWADDLICDPAIEEAAFVDVTPVRRAWEAHLTGRGDHASVLWPVLMLESWRRHHHPEWSVR